MKKIFKKIFEKFTHLIGRLNGKYYFEDYVRVYPNAIRFNKLGRKVATTKNDINNLLNHVKFYNFAAQFVQQKKVADIGCGSGYGCEILKKSGAAYVYGCDVSKVTIDFAQKHFSKDVAEFGVASITDLKIIKDQSYDVTINSEVMEHIKEYNMEYKAISELKRITKKNGLLIVATPNTEMFPGHGFDFEEIDQLFKKNFSKYCLFENALYRSSGPEGEHWQNRLKNNHIGIAVSEDINFDETCILPGPQCLVKKGLPAGSYKFDRYDVDTTLLHNTHSWIVLAIND